MCQPFIGPKIYEDPFFYHFFFMLFFFYFILSFHLKKNNKHQILIDRIFFIFATNFQFFFYQIDVCNRVDKVVNSYIKTLGMLLQ
jgi:hypothetical protein